MNQQGSDTSAKLIAIYARVSTARQEEEGTVETQLTAVRDFARQHGHVVVKEYIDNGWSGDILARPSLDELRADASKSIWQGVLIYDPDRLARRYSYQELVMDELREAGREVMFVTVPSPKNSEDKILHGVRGLFAEYERAKITERFRLGKVRKVKDGHVLVSEAPYGYTYVPMLGDRHGFYEIEPSEASVVKRIFESVANEGVTLRQLVRKLQEWNIQPRKSRRGVWNTSTLSTLLRNTAYIGEAHWGASYAVAPERPIKSDTYRKIKKTSRKLRPKDEWIFIPVPAIVDRGVFERARAQLEANYALSKRNKKNEYLLAGKLRCICGRTRCGEGVLHGKHLYYRCSDRVMSFPLPPTCKEKGINARIADELVWQKIADLMSSSELMSKQVERWINNHETKVSSSTANVMAIKAEVKELRERIRRYNQAYGAGVFTLEQLREYTQPANEKIAALELRLSKVKEQTPRVESDAMPSQDQIQEFAEQARKGLHDLNFVQKRAIVVNAVEKVVGTPRELKIFGFIPVTHHVEFQTDHRHGVDAASKNLGDEISQDFDLRCFHNSRFCCKIPFTLQIKLPPPKHVNIKRVRLDNNAENRMAT